MTSQKLYLYGYTAVYCDCGAKAFVIDKNGLYVSDLPSPFHFQEIVELDRFDTRCGIYPEGRYNNLFDE